MPPLLMRVAVERNDGPFVHFQVRKHQVLPYGVRIRHPGTASIGGIFVISMNGMAILELGRVDLQTKASALRVYGDRKKSDALARGRGAIIRSACGRSPSTRCPAQPKPAAYDSWSDLDRTWGKDFRLDPARISDIIPQPAAGPR